MNKQYKMDMVWHNNVLIYGQIFIKAIHLFYVFIRNHSMWQQFHVLRVAEDVDPYDGR